MKYNKIRGGNSAETERKRTMKKIVSLALVLAMMLACASAAFAAPFVGSPTTSGGPELVGTTSLSGDDVAVKITAYRDRASLPADKRADLEAAYQAIADGNVGAISGNLAVSDIFDISYSDFGSHGGVSITLRANSLDKFAAVLHYVNGQFVKVDATVNEDKTEVTFSVDDLSPFAIVVETAAGEANGSGTGAKDAGKTSPQTSDYSAYLLTVGSVFALFAVAFFALSRKKSFEK